MGITDQDDTDEVGAGAAGSEHKDEAAVSDTGGDSDPGASTADDDEGSDGDEPG